MAKTKARIIEVDPSTLTEIDDRNPNVFEPAKYQLLVRAIDEKGFLQPILVVEDGKGGHILVDGVHRSKAAAFLQLPLIPAVLAENIEDARLLRIAMNNLRGNLNLSEVGKQLQELFDEGYGMEEVELTGYSDWEIQALMDSVADLDDEALLAGADTAPPKPDKEKTFPLSFKFDSESERARYKEALEAAGLGNAMDGLKCILEDNGYV